MRGQPKTGFRMTAKRKALLEKGIDPRTMEVDKVAAKQILAEHEIKSQDSNLPRIIYPPAKEESDAKIAEKLGTRFQVLEELTDSAIDGDVVSLIVSGPAGLGKSYTVENAISHWDPTEDKHSLVKGYVRPTGLYKLLYQNRQKGRVLVLDDADTVFYDDTSLNLLKGACDTTDVRKIGWHSEAVLIDEDSAKKIPRNFVFEGTIIFLTNLDFDAMIARGHKLAPHLEALVSRSHYVDLAMKTRRDYMIRIKQVVGQGLFRKVGLTPEQEADTMAFLDEHCDDMRELSLRSALKVGAIRKTNKPNWKLTAEISCCRNQ